MQSHISHVLLGSGCGAPLAADAAAAVVLPWLLLCVTRLAGSGPLPPSWLRCVMLGCWRCMLGGRDESELMRRWCLLSEREGPRVCPCACPLLLPLPFTAPFIGWPLISSGSETGMRSAILVMAAGPPMSSRLEITCAYAGRFLRFARLGAGRTSVGIPRYSACCISARRPCACQWGVPAQHVRPTRQSVKVRRFPQVSTTKKKKKKKKKVNSPTPSQT
jgi:hypothetical protein